MESNVTNLVSVFMTDVQGQQSTLNSTNSAASAEKTADFSQYMKASVSTLAEQSQKSSRNAEVTVQKEVSQGFEETSEHKETAAQEVPKTQDTAQAKETSKLQESTAENVKEAEKVQTEENSELNSKTEQVISISEELKQSLEEIKNDLKQKIMDGFEITEEELEEALEVLAINIYDLLQTDQLKELAVYVSGEENLVSMITNGDMYTAYKEVAAGIEELSSVLMDKLSITPEELPEVINEVKNIFMGIETNDEMVLSLENAMAAEETVLSESTVIPEDAVITENQTSEEVMPAGSEISAEKNTSLVKNTAIEKNSSTEMQQTTGMEETNVSETAKEAMDTTKTEIQEEVSSAITEITKEGKDALKEQSVEGNEKLLEKTEGTVQKTSTEVEADNQKQSFSDTTKQGETKEQGLSKENKDTAAVQTTTTYSTIAGDTEVQTVVQTQRTDFEGIVKQIVEQIKVQIRPDTTSMELQLNPENLGKVNLHISSKEGAVTAQLFVQNEAVKTMIEGQLAVLREAMVQQGVKVEAVEVAVETGSFERNLEQHSEQQKQEAQKQAKSYQHRQINLLAGIDEEAMNEAEILRTHIMRESGNSVDMDA